MNVPFDMDKCLTIEGRFIAYLATFITLIKIIINYLPWNVDYRITYRLFKLCHNLPTTTEFFVIVILFSNNLDGFLHPISSLLMIFFIVWDSYLHFHLHLCLTFLFAYHFPKNICIHIEYAWEYFRSGHEGSSLYYFKSRERR